MSEDEIIRQLKSIQASYGFFSQERRAIFAAIAVVKDNKRNNQQNLKHFN